MDGQAEKVYSYKKEMRKIPESIVDGLSLSRLLSLSLLLIPKVGSRHNEKKKLVMGKEKAG